MCMFRAKAAGRPWPEGQGLDRGEFLLSCCKQMNWHRMAEAVHGIEGICGSGGKGEKRKMFSHREHGFPTQGRMQKMRICLDGRKNLGVSRLMPSSCGIFSNCPVVLTSSKPVSAPPD